MLVIRPSRILGYPVIAFTRGRSKSYAAAQVSPTQCCIFVKFPGESWAPCSPGHPVATAQAVCDGWTRRADYPESEWMTDKLEHGHVG